MNDEGQPGPGWTVVLRRRPTRIVECRPEGGYTDEFEIVCCDCGDDPGLDYREVSPALQRIRGPYPIASGITAYVQHARRHPRPQGTHWSGRGSISSRVQHAAAIRRGPTPAERR
jgi:hypothetical protein